MKIKDFIGLNPEAEIVVVFEDGSPYEGKLSYGWDSADCGSEVDTKLNAKEVCIFLGNNEEK